MSQVQTQFQAQDGRLIVRREQDVEPILEAAKRAHREGVHGSRDLRHAASLPMVLVEKYCNDHAISFAEFMREPKHVKAMCNDPALAHFRIWPGKV
jgi:hypothetical protein